MPSSRSASKTGPRDETRSCSFCNKEQYQVATLIAGPGAFICNECVDLCDRILDEQPAPEFGAADQLSDDELLVSLPRMQALVVQVEARLRRHVRVLRDRDISWSRIGDALGVSKQAAWERFSGED